jgi:hypothetical protein
LTFDRSTGNRIIGDVGQDSWEKIDFETRTDPGLTKPRYFATFCLLIADG